MWILSAVAHVPILSVSVPAPISLLAPIPAWVHRVQQGHKITWNLTTTDIGSGSGTDTDIIGMVIAYAEGMYLSWRTVAWLSLVYIAISLILVTAWIPESPLWLVARGRVDEADHSLKWFNGKNTQLHKEKLASMVKSQDMKALVSSGFFQRMKGFLKPTGYKPMLVLSGLFFFQQFSGIYSTLFYAVTFFESGKTLGHPAHSDRVLRAQRRGVELLRGSVRECVVLISPS
uniref:Uncharacterized protein n=1 Tax=Timema monikensis TaxID=170555 RepID=A0A7R9EIE6_9NEOP|nr:unnamed protein product [Timema monikensis]